MDLDLKPSREGSSESAREDATLQTVNADVEKSAASVPPTVDTNDPGPPPDGGLRAWSVVLGGWCAVFASFGWINCIGVFQEYYESNQLKSYSSSTIAWIPSTESFMLFFWGPVAGKLADDFGPRVPIFVGSFLHVFGLMMTSISKEYYQIFLAQSVCSAIGCSLLFYPTISAIGTWFLKHRALAFGVAVSGSSIGGIIMPIMVAHLVQTVGFGWAMRAVAFLILGLLVIANLTLKSRLPPKPRKFVFKDFLTPFTEKPFILLTAGSFFIYVGGFLPFNFLIVEGRANGMSAELASYLVPILNAASTFGRIVPAHLGDVYGVFNIMILHTLASGIFTLALWLPARSNAPLIVFAALYGFTSGCTLSIIPAMVATISDVRQLGTRSGALYAVSAVGVLTGSPIAGAISGRQHGKFEGLIVFCGVALLIGTGFTVLSRQAQVGMRFKAKI